mgnify:CR=1 FL=1
MLAFGFYWVGEDVLTRRGLMKRIIYLLFIMIILSFVNTLITIIIMKQKGQTFSIWYFRLGFILSILLGITLYKMFFSIKKIYNKKQRQ